MSRIMVVVSLGLLMIGLFDTSCAPGPTLSNNKQDLPLIQFDELSGSKDWRQREKALAIVLKDQDQTDNREIRTRLTALLHQENQIVDQELKNSEGRSGVADDPQYGEDYVEYYSRLLDAASHTAEKSGDNNLTIVVAKAVYATDSSVANFIETKGDVVATALLADLQRQSTGKQAQFLSVLAEMARPGTSTTANVKEQIQASLVDNLERGNASEVRLAAVSSLGGLISDNIRAGAEANSSAAVIAIEKLRHVNDAPLRREVHMSLQEICSADARHNDGPKHMTCGSIIQSLSSVR
jgi:hypothetical protein